MNCVADMRKETVNVTRVGANETRDNHFRIIGLNETVEIPDGQTFSVMGQGALELDRFQKEEGDSEPTDESAETIQLMQFNGCTYAMDSQSLKQEREKHDKMMVDLLKSYN